ncbi:HAD family hydrolase [Roseobacter sp. YSTF-M11]|uniref:HAD family hydrolase n=1 Tax=Roseobacter insulae TaxID=2859783 RepID=A0A9X1FW73_9RHOB|nr:HAD family hydrolase [Roseobacter insulae]MBW4708467.1 HAD family hydrolase [Roseobacter insulae]
MTTIRGVLFDKDGTLFDFATTWEAWAVGFLNRMTRSPEDAANLGAQIGFDYKAQRFLPDSLVIAGTPGEVAQALLPYMPGATLQDVIGILNEEAETAPQIEAVPLVPFLTDLRSQGLRLGVATNDAEAPARAHLAAAKVTDLFDFIAGFDSGHGAKPQAGQLLAFAKETGLAPETVAMVGDSTHDLIAGRAAGMRCVGVLTGMAEHAVLAPHADVVLENIGALPDWIAQQT